MSNPIGNLGTIPTLTIGGRVYTDLTNLKVLIAHMVGNPAASSFRLVGGHAGSGYQVTANKTLTVSGLYCQTNDSNGPSMKLYQCDNDATYSNGAFTPTNPIYMEDESASSASNHIYFKFSTTAGASSELNPMFTVVSTATQRYLTGEITGTGNVTVRAYGYEA